MSGISPVARQVAVTKTTTPEPAAAPATASPAPSERAAMSKAEAEHTATTLNRVLNPLDLNLLIHYDDENHRYGFKIVDRKTNEVIREFPTPGVLEAARDALAGMFIDQRG